MLVDGRNDVFVSVVGCWVLCHSQIILGPADVDMCFFYTKRPCVNRGRMQSSVGKRSLAKDERSEQLGLGNHTQSSMTWVEKIFFGVIAFKALALTAWIVLLRREVKQEKKKIH